MDIDSLMDTLRDRTAMGPALGYRVKFDLKGEGFILLDGTATPSTVSGDDGEADTTLVLSKETAAELIEGRLDPTLAYMTGKLKVDGSMGVALKLASILGD